MLNAFIGVILRADFTGYLLLIILPKSATRIVVIIICGVKFSLLLHLDDMKGISGAFRFSVKNIV